MNLLDVVLSEIEPIWCGPNWKEKKKSDLELKTNLFSLDINREKLKWEM